MWPKSKEKKISIPCKVCDQGELIRKEVFRLSTPVVVIGYLLLVPSVIGMLFFGAVALIGVAADSGLTFGVSVAGLVGSLISGLLGWLLVMKKQVLQCSFCGASTPTSQGASMVSVAAVFVILAAVCLVVFALKVTGDSKPAHLDSPAASPALLTADPPPVVIRPGPPEANAEPIIAQPPIEPVSVAVEPEPVATPESPAAWIKIKEWSGTSTKDTEIFQVTSPEWRVHWTNSNDDLFSIIVYDDTGKTVSVAANTLKAGSDTSYVHRRGNFYLKITAGNTKWSVSVEHTQ